MRRLSPLLLPALLLALLPAPSSSAQETPSVRLTLLSQTAWNSPSQPTLSLRFRAENVGPTPIGDLAIGATLYARVIARSEYERSLSADPLVVIAAETFAREGELAPGAIRDLEISLTLDSPGIDQQHSGVYPLKLDLRSGSTSLGALRSPAIFLVREPETPLAMSWTFVLHHPIAFRPDGTFADASLETSISPGGTIAGQIRALLELVRSPEAPTVELAISPILLTQLGRMRNGYLVADTEVPREVSDGEGGAELAERILQDLRDIAAAPNVRITALPFSTPELPALYGGGLGRDVGVQLERGREVVGAFLDTTPVPGILRPPGAGLDDLTLKGLMSSGITTLILNPGTVSVPPQPLDLTGPATARVGDGSLAAVLPDPSTHAVIREIATDDPVRGAQAALGELAAIWQERPGEARAVAVVLDEDTFLPGPFFPAFVRGVSSAPWLEPVTSAALVASFPPDEPLELVTPTLRRFGGSYVAELKQARRRVETLRSMLPEESEEPNRLDTMLLLAEARQFLSEPADGLAFIAAVRAEVESVLRSLTLETVSAVTLTSESGGGIPVTVTSSATEPLRFSLRLVSQHLRETLSSDLELAPGASETIRFQAQLRSTGRFPVRVQLVSPSGRILDQETIAVRSTEYNRVALVITIGAALVLVLLWARRFVPRRNT